MELEDIFYYYDLHPSFEVKLHLDIKVNIFLKNVKYFE